MSKAKSMEDIRKEREEAEKLKKDRSVLQSRLDKLKEDDRVAMDEMESRMHATEKMQLEKRIKELNTKIKDTTEGYGWGGKRRKKTKTNRKTNKKQRKTRKFYKGGQ